MESKTNNEFIELICFHPLPDKGFEWIYEVIAEIETEESIAQVLKNISLDF